MATLQKKRTPQTPQKQETSTWESIFPAQQATPQQSALFVKKLLAVSLSSITYLRALFPEDAYCTQNLDGLSLKLLLESSKCKGSNEMVSWIKAVFEAIDKKYLRQLTLAVFTDADQPEVALETYTYKFRYTDEGMTISEFQSSVKERDDISIKVQKSTQKMLRTLILLTQGLQPLPPGVSLGMKLGYYDEVTPADYEPKGFQKNCPDMFVFRNDPVNIKVGDVSTHHHSVKLRVSVDKQYFSPDDASPENIQEDDHEHDQERDKSPNAKNASLSCDGSEEVKRSITTSTNFFRFHTSLLEQSFEKTLEQPSLDILDNSIDGQGVERAVGEGMPCNRMAARGLDNSIIATPVSVTNPCDVVNSGEENAVPSNTPDMLTHAAFLPTSSAKTEDGQLVPQASQKFSVAELVGTNLHSNLRTPALSQHVSPGSATAQENSLVSPVFPSTDFPVRCVCKVNCDDGLMILCSKCKNWQHAICFSVLVEAEAPEHHVCDRCATPTSPCTDPALTKPSPQVEDLCLYRRTLGFLRGYRDQVIPSVLGVRLGVDISKATKVFDTLRADHLLKPSNKRGGKYVDAERLETHFLVFLQKKELNSASQPLSTPESRNIKTMKRESDWDVDETPDLPITSLRAAMNGCDVVVDTQELINVTLDSEQNVLGMEKDFLITTSLDQVGSTQDVAVGTQKAFLTLNNGLESQSEKDEVHATVATTGGTLPQSLGSQTNSFSSIVPAVHPAFGSGTNEKQDIDEDDNQSEELGRGMRKKGKRKLLPLETMPKLSRRKKGGKSAEQLGNEFEISNSQDSDVVHLGQRLKSSRSTNRLQPL